jgi:hypothetical protein
MPGLAACNAAARRFGVAINVAVNGLLGRTKTDFTLCGLVAELAERGTIVGCRTVLVVRS